LRHQQLERKLNKDTKARAIDYQEMSAYEYAYARRALDEAGDSVVLRDHVKLDQEHAAKIAANARFLIT